MKNETPTLEDKIEMYERFLHKINMCMTCCNNDSIQELLLNADVWSYNHRRGNGMLSEEDQQKLINSAFWKLCDTPKSDAKVKEMQKAYMKHAKNIDN